MQEVSGSSISDDVSFLSSIVQPWVHAGIENAYRSYHGIWIVVVRYEFHSQRSNQKLLEIYGGKRKANGNRVKAITWLQYMIIDSVGSQTPVTPRCHQYLFTCTCVFSDWYWVIPTVDDTSVTAARAYDERVMFDIAGMCAILALDEGKAFVEGVVRQSVYKFGM